MAKSQDRKADAAVAEDPSEFRVTEFGRRRVSRVPAPLRGLGWLLAWPFRLVHGWFRGTRVAAFHPDGSAIPAIPKGLRPAPTRSERPG